eukprot:jgi/Ulvmu1/1771/UM118_0010.1
MDNNAKGQADAPQSFLTEAQQAALDAALLSKEKAARQATKPKHDSRSVRKHGTAHVKPVHGLAGDRKSKSLRSGETKKKGAGGKFTWGAMLSEAAVGGDAPPALDRNDPNYDSEEDAARAAADALAAAAATDDDAPAPAVPGSSPIVQAVNKLKEDIMELLREYLESGDAAEAGACIAELQLPQYDFYLVKRALTLAMDRKDRDREAVSVLLSSLYGQYISPAMMQKGFVEVLEDFDGLLLDVPDAGHLMTLFICRAITDDILPPSFVSRLTPPPASALAELKKKCAAQLNNPHSAERLLRCWGADATLSFEEARARIKAMLQEYVSSGDMAEVERGLRALAAPFFHHEVVKQAILMATEDMKHAKEPMVELLAVLAARGEVSALQLYKGFQRVVDQLDDLALDTPGLHAAYHDFYAACVARGTIDAADATAIEAAEHAAAVEAALPAGENGSAARALTPPPPAQPHTVPEFKRASVAAVREYFDSSDADEVARILTDTEDYGMLHLFVKIVLQSGMERSFRERELASRLLVSLVPDPISHEQVAFGLSRTLAALDDYVLDVPNAAHLMTLFLARAIVDELVPPAFLTRVLDTLHADSLAIVVVRNTGRLLASTHAAELVLKCWHGGVETVEDLKAGFKAMILEHCTNPDWREVKRSLQELAAPHYHHEFVKQALAAAFERPKATDALVDLLQHLSYSGDVTSTQMAMGFDRVKDNLADYELDCPSARTIYDDIAARGREQKWL